MAENNKHEPQKSPGIPLDYQNLGERRPSSATGFFAGLAIGTAVSCSFYFGFVPHAKGALGSDVVVSGFITIPLLKLLLGIGLARDKRYRAWGAGILLSMGLVLLIAVATCFASI